VPRIRFRRTRNTKCAQTVFAAATTPPVSRVMGLRRLAHVFRPNLGDSDRSEDSNVGVISIVRARGGDAQARGISAQPILGSED